MSRNWMPCLGKSGMVRTSAFNSAGVIFFLPQSKAPLASGWMEGRPLCDNRDDRSAYFFLGFTAAQIWFFDR